MRKLLFPLCFALSACLPANAPDTASRNPRGTHVLAQIKTFPAPTPKRASVSNADLQRDFLDLSFMLESGTPLLHFSRFEGPISLKVVGNVPVTLPGDLGRLIYRLKSEAGLDIFITSQDTANIYLHTIPSSQIKAALPSAACFVVPNVSSLTEYRALRKTKLVSWQSMRERRKISIFIPNDTSPQEIRDCLHEELAQAIGPLNDMYRLPQSIFNDDNVHTVLTAYDMLILRMFYAPELRSGMTRAEVKSRLPRVSQIALTQLVTLSRRAPQAIRLGHGRQLFKRPSSLSNHCRLKLRLHKRRCVSQMKKIGMTTARPILFSFLHRLCMVKIQRPQRQSSSWQINFLKMCPQANFIAHMSPPNSPLFHYQMAIQLKHLPFSSHI